MNRMKAKYSYWVACVALLLVAGCSPKEAAAPAGSADAITGNWVLIDPASAYTVTLRVEDGSLQMAGSYSLQLTGKAPVNMYFAAARFSEGPSIESGPTGTGSVSDLGGTKMAGPPAAMQFEADYLAHLGAVNKAEVVGASRLELSYGGAVPGELAYKRY